VTINGECGNGHAGERKPQKDKEKCRKETGYFHVYLASKDVKQKYIKKNDLHRKETKTTIEYQSLVGHSVV
jgi:hypothetical protein